MELWKYIHSAVEGFIIHLESCVYYILSLFLFNRVQSERFFIKPGINEQITFICNLFAARRC